MHKEHDCYVPELVFGHLSFGTEKKPSKVGLFFKAFFFGGRGNLEVTSAFRELIKNQHPKCLTVLGMSVVFYVGVGKTYLQVAIGVNIGTITEDIVLGVCITQYNQTGFDDSCHWWTLKSQVDERQLQRLGEKGDLWAEDECSDVTTSDEPR